MPDTFPSETGKASAGVAGWMDASPDCRRSNKMALFGITGENERLLSSSE
jgi:hypothetical protein